MFTSGREARRQTLADAMADLQGRVDGPPELSTNPVHLDGFGRSVIPLLPPWD
jgi:hypothetical protein